MGGKEKRKRSNLTFEFSSHMLHVECYFIIHCKPIISDWELFYKMEKMRIGKISLTNISNQREFACLENQHLSSYLFYLNTSIYYWEIQNYFSHKINSNYCPSLLTVIFFLFFFFFLSFFLFFLLFFSLFLFLSLFLYLFFSLFIVLSVYFQFIFFHMNQ